MAPFFSSTDSMGDQVFFSLACDLRTLGCGHWSCVTCRLAMDTQEIARAGGLETTREKPPVPSEKFPGQFVSSDAGSSNLRYGRPIRVLSSTLSFLMLSARLRKSIHVFVDLFARFANLTVRFAVLSFGSGLFER